MRQRHHNPAGGKFRAWRRPRASAAKRNAEGKLRTAATGPHAVRSLDAARHLCLGLLLPLRARWVDLRRCVKGAGYSANWALGGYAQSM